ncbi:MAG TPA: 5-formyltetrahydrofolate cyclo-ligase [Pararhodobacter sp.]|uniref:5-formyltetrahydrofolate cyclo-ligase n=1 Tax=Pararhodobacter sp. TaxID=2127056 RepID=UPI002CDF1314|nr:5-formyltetrahydrofolate cyclo-ligase [Pararhodobacter sp.]HPD94176.1 5-formyltetrahydrofolate cyclo-ligase [Pararhodobacter sp.]
MPEGRRLASSPCLAGEIAPDGFDPLAVDPEQARDVARWRRAERIRLRAARDSLSVTDRQAASAALSVHLRRFLVQRFSGAVGQTLSAYWPIKGEPDLRDLMVDLHGRGVTFALPVVEVKAAPMVFRRWMPGMAMVRGDWNIPVPPPEADVLVPDFTLAPCLGWTADGYRLGWGGGYFDRTLAGLTPRPITIGIALNAARLPTIFPQPHDIPLDLILTEDGIAATRPD